MFEMSYSQECQKIVDGVCDEVEKLRNTLMVWRWNNSDVVEFAMKRFLRDTIELRKMIEDEDDELSKLIADIKEMRHASIDVHGDYVKISTRDGEIFEYYYCPESKIFETDDSKWMTCDDIVSQIKRFDGGQN